MTGETGDAAALPLTMQVHTGAMTIARLAADAAIPAWLPSASWCSMTRTGDELSVVCESRFVPAGIRQSPGWRLMQVRGPLDFSLTGILHRIAAPLTEAGISLFAISTFDTDYVLVGDKDLREAIACLSGAGIVVRAPD